jgi:hypothetical protein
MKRALLLLPLAVGCSHLEIPPDLAEAQIDHAWLEDYQWTASGLIGGALTGHAWLYAVDTSGRMHTQYVKVRGGLVGFAFELTQGGGRTVAFDLPPLPISGADLFERYEGSFEAFVVGIGFASLHLRNEPGVQLDDQGGGYLIGLSVSWAELRLVPAEPPPKPDTGDTTDTADSGAG